ELCPALGIAIPVGKDSLSMKTVWQHDGETREVVAPLSLIVSAFAPVSDVRKTLTPQLRTDCGDSDLVFIDLGKGQQRLGGSALAQVFGQAGHHAPDLDDPPMLKRFFASIQDLNRDGLLLAYHDRSDGGLFATACEMAFAGHTGMNAHLDDLGDDVLAALFNEELGALLQVRHNDTDQVLETLRESGLGHHSHVIGEPGNEDHIDIHYDGAVIFSAQRAALHQSWAETSYQIQKLRDNAECAEQEFALVGDPNDPGLSPRLTFDIEEDITAPYITKGARPRVAILREQGVNGQIEMAAAFDRAGFAAVDVHMTDLISGRLTLSDFLGVVAGGGFSYGDVLGGGGGWAKSILFNNRARDAFGEFLARGDVFGLGVCNGCQMFSQLRELVPGATHWPRFMANRSEQFEARFCQVEVLASPSIFLSGMHGSVVPIAVAHGEGRAAFDCETPQDVLQAGKVALRYVDNHGDATERYPHNPNGSPLGIAGLSNDDGRFTIMMPHPERVFRTVQNSWHPDDWGEDGPWMRMFRNARVWVA
ncbi:MAG: phosphoribosylformylglycinamidine synthase, partial [Gammaproteobacteria bacterium]